MIVTKNFYISEDGIQFETESDAIEYDRDETVISAISKMNMGEPLPKPKIGEGYCLETRQHTQGGIIQILNLILFIVKNHVATYNADCSDFQIKYNNLKIALKNLSDNYTTYDFNMDFRNIIRDLERLIIFYYQFPDKYFNKYLEQTTIYKIIDRLKNTSYVSGKEYYHSDWTYKEDKWDDFVKQEKEYLANGGKYR